MKPDVSITAEAESRAMHSTSQRQEHCEETSAIPGDGKSPGAESSADSTSESNGHMTDENELSIEIELEDDSDIDYLEDHLYGENNMGENDNCLTCVSTFRH